LLFLAVIVSGTAVDLAAKHWAYAVLADPASRWSPERIHSLQSKLLIVDLVWQPNRGAVFGSWAGQTVPLVAFTVLALGLLVWLFADSRRGQVWLHLFLSLIVAGAVGNLYDRLMYQHVRDFLRLNLRFDWLAWGGPEHYLWPYIFNVADVFITVGVAGLFLIWLIGLVRHKPAPADSGAASGER